MKQTGRSTVEILGVIVIMGLLTIAGIGGYRIAMTKYRAAAIMNEMSQRAQLLSAATMVGRRPTTMEMGNTLQLGHAVKLLPILDKTDFFAIEVYNVQGDVCTEIVNNYTLATLVVDETILLPGDSCPDDATMTFLYLSDLDGRGDNYCNHGELDYATFECFCSGGTYFNSTIGDCVCPGGYVLSEESATCIVSNCPNGQFETQEKGCVPCDDETSFKILKEDMQISMCNACPNREYSETYSKCILHKCASGTFLGNEDKECLSCSRDGASFVSSSDYAVRTCNACGNRYYAGGTCIKSGLCESGLSYPNIRGNGECLDCADVKAGYVGSLTGNEGEANALCQACKNKDGVKNRDVQLINTFYRCVKTVCDTGEFKGNDGRCYLCDDETPVPASKTECEKCASRSQNAKGVCVTSNCPTDNNHTSVSDGGCYACDTKTIFNSTEAECNACGNKRMWLVSAKGTGYCHLAACKLGETVPYLLGTDCLECQSNCYTGVSDVSRKHCEACGNYLDEESGWCMNSENCVSGKQFQGIMSYESCVDCAHTSTVQVGNTVESINMCLNCVTEKRFFVGGKCYRCDTIEEPVVTTDEERQYCLDCAFRRITDDNKCVLNVKSDG